jgi:hypothetical protein
MDNGNGFKTMSQHADAGRSSRCCSSMADSVWKTASGRRMLWQGLRSACLLP